MKKTEKTEVTVIKKPKEPKKVKEVHPSLLAGVKAQYSCPKHGTVSEVITSNLSDKPGTWCFRCYLDLLGDPIEAIDETL